MNASAAFAILRQIVLKGLPERTDERLPIYEALSEAACSLSPADARDLQDVCNAIRRADELQARLFAKAERSGE